MRLATDPTVRSHLLSFLLCCLPWFLLIFLHMVLSTSVLGSNRNFLGHHTPMSENPIQMQLSFISLLSPTRHPPCSLLRAILVLVDLQDLRPLKLLELPLWTQQPDRVPHLFYPTDEKCFFTYAHYVEPMTSIAVTIYDLQNAISARIHHTWDIRIPTLTLQLWFEDL